MAEESRKSLRKQPDYHYPLKCLTKTFPFGVLFRDRPDEIIVVAVMHLHRDPDYWKHR